MTPARTESGYRKFSHADIERLRFVLTMQRDHYLPLKVIRVRDVMVSGRPFVYFQPRTPGRELIVRIDEASWQDTFPVLDEEQRLVGLVSADALRALAAVPDGVPATIAADLMQPPVFAHLDDDLRSATAQMLQCGLRELPVLDEQSRVCGFIDEMETAKAYLEATAQRAS